MHDVDHTRRLRLANVEVVSKLKDELKTHSAHAATVVFATQAVKASTAELTREIHEIDVKIRQIHATFSKEWVSQCLEGMAGT